MCHEIVFSKSKVYLCLKNESKWEAVVAQLVERLLSIPEVRGSTPVMGKINIEHFFVIFFIINCIEKTKINKKRPGMAHFKRRKQTKLNKNRRYFKLKDQSNAEVHYRFPMNISTKSNITPREHWSSGYGRRLMYRRLCVWIQALDGYFFTIIFVKIVLFV